MKHSEHCLLVTLIGLQGVGKTTTGARVAGSYSLPSIDLDHIVQERYWKKRGIRRSMQEIFRDLGEDAFRQEELQALYDYVKTTLCHPVSIMSLGGGALPVIDALAHLQSSRFQPIFIYLFRSKERFIERLVQRKHQGLAPPQWLNAGASYDIDAACAIWEKRHAAFHEKADYCFDVDRLSYQQIEREISAIIQSFFCQG